MAMLSGCGFEIQESTRILFYILSLLCVTQMDEKKRLASSMFSSPWKRMALFFLYAYTAFALVGQRIFIYPFDSTPGVADIFEYAVAFAWSIPVVKSMFFLFEGFSSFAMRKNGRKITTPIFIALIVFLLLFPAVIDLIACNPGITSTDTGYCMGIAAHNIVGLFNWHPVFYCLVLHAIISVWDSTYAVIFVQYFFWAYVMTELLLYLRKKRVSDSVLVVAAFLSGINVVNFMYVNTIWKDIPYAYSILWVFVILAKLSLDFEEYKRKWYIYLELLVALVGTFFYRGNGMVSYVVIALAAAVILWKNGRVLITLAASCICIAIIHGPLYDYLKVQPLNNYGIYIGLGQDILGTYYAGGEVSEETLQMIGEMTSHDTAEYEYNPAFSNQNYSLSVEPVDFILNYVDMFFKNPLTMVRAIVDREDLAWDIFQGEDLKTGGSVNYYNTQDGLTGDANWKSYYPAREYRSIYDSVVRETTYTVENQWISALAWRCGILTLAGITAFIFLIVKKGRGRYIILMAPVIGHILGLLLSTGWSEFRYFWPLNLLNAALLLIFPVISSRVDYDEVMENARQEK